MSRTQMVMVVARDEGSVSIEDLALRLEQWLMTQGMRLSKDGKPLEDGHLHHEEAMRTCSEFTHSTLPILLAHGAV
ncbi:MAG: hypothetical protein IPM01_28505 [Burkholderiaceae bacterium]|nr:hypothetical protein [Burkholderiaceae bacterium]